MIRFGVDFGGTKIEAAALDIDGRFVARVRGATPPDYPDRLDATREVLAEAERQAGVVATRVGVGGPGSPSPVSGLMRNSNSTVLNDRPFPADLARVGVGGPGSVSPASGLIRNSNSLALNDQPFPADLQRLLGRPVRYANDADCLALSEATDGAGKGAGVVCAVIIGTGCGSGIAVDGRLIQGRNGVAGEWGHTPLPWPRADELPGITCWCGRINCLELWLSGTGFAREAGRPAEAAVAAGDHAALDLYIDRLARGLAVVVDLLDPDVIVLGGGMSNIGRLYEALPAAIAPHVFSDVFTTPVVKAAHGDSSGVRGAAWLWPEP